MLSPFHANAAELAALPPLMLVVGANEQLLGETMLFAQRAQVGTLEPLLANAKLCMMSGRSSSPVNTSTHLFVHVLVCRVYTYM